MPLLFNKEIENEIHFLIWELTESLDELLSVSQLSSDDKETYSEISHLQKQIEFLAGRLAIKKLCEIENISFEGIIKDENGKPFLKNSEFEMSISHTINYIGVIMKKNSAIGIDIEKPRTQLLKIVPRLFSPIEVAFIDNEIEKATLYWSAKEALYKLYGKRKVDFRENLFLDWEDGKLFGEIKMPDYEARHKIIFFPLGQYLSVIAH